MSTTGSPVPRYGHWVNGAELAPASGQWMVSTKAGGDEVVCEIAVGNETDVDLAVRASAAAFPAWRDRKPIERGRVLLRIAQAIRDDAQRLGELEAAEAGKVVAHAVGEMEGAAQFFEFFGGMVNLPAGGVLDLGPAMHGYTRREPYGVVGVITPWNGALNHAGRAVARRSPSATRS